MEECSGAYSTRATIVLQLHFHVHRRLMGINCRRYGDVYDFLRAANICLTHPRNASLKGGRGGRYVLLQLTYITCGYFCGAARERSGP